MRGRRWVRWAVLAVIVVLLLLNLVVIIFQARGTAIGNGLAGLYVGVPTLVVAGLLVALLIRGSRHEVRLLEKHLRTLEDGSAWFVFAKTPALTATLAIVAPGGVQWADPDARFGALSLTRDEVSVWDDPHDPHPVIIMPAESIVRIAPGEALADGRAGSAASSVAMVQAIILSVALDGRTADLPFVPYISTETGARVLPDAAHEHLLGALRDAPFRTA